MYSTPSQNAKEEKDFLEQIQDLREFDVPYIQRVCIDYGIRVGCWFTVTADIGKIDVKKEDKLDRPDPVVLAFDIECTKAPLKFPDAEFDQIIMISYMLDEEDPQGFLIVNREIVSEDIDDFEYTPKPALKGNFTIFNEKDELCLLQRFFEHIKDVRPHIYVTYNGDFFDWPFVEKRAEKHGINMKQEIGISASNDGVYSGRFAVHLDCFAWVQRDSYLPQGSQGLKAVTKKKLGYDPVELDPEDMLPFASSKPQTLAAYSVSDAVATYYLYMRYIHSFVYSLCMIIPMPAGDTLRKGTGTLCESLLMVEAFQRNIIAPNKQREELVRFYEGHLLDSDTYIGGHVECMRSGVFRDEIPMKFRVNPETVQSLIDRIDETMQFALKVEAEIKFEDVLNYDEVKNEIVRQLEIIRDEPLMEINPLIYHLDVTSMYPNIILSNRLQPVAIVDKATCAACDFNRPGKRCQRHMKWKWRGKYFPLTKGDYRTVRAQAEFGTISKKDQEEGIKSFQDLSDMEQAARVTERVKTFCQKTYRKTYLTKEEEKEDVVCQRENPFYVDTVRAFRDRRYKYKWEAKSWHKKLAKATGEAQKKEASSMATLYDSMQLAHKCILNSFYGYVMRRGSRWYSMPMAAITTYVGAEIIKLARELVENLGIPLELDTDGIWGCLPGNFPENFEIKTKDPKKPRWTLSYPCSMLNVDTHKKFTNHMYQELSDPDKHTYKVSSECSIFFEVDGPYKCMILPASPEEGKTLKKRYAVYNKDGSLAELKGFEIKRRGELKLIKIFQGEVFKAFLEGHTLEEVYAAVGKVCNHWLDLLERKGADLSDSYLFDLIAESKNMSKSLAHYEGQKSTSITCARRVGDFLGSKMIQDAGITCRYVISRKPVGAPVSERAIPTAIFSAEPAIMKQYMRRWMKDQALSQFDIRSILDWDYYTKRLGDCMKKIVSIPAAFQKVPNPCPRLEHPKWLAKRLREQNDPFSQRKINSFFSAAPNPTDQPRDVDMEDVSGKWPMSQFSQRRKKQEKENGSEVSIKRPRRAKRSQIVDDEDDDDDVVDRFTPSQQEDDFHRLHKKSRPLPSSKDVEMKTEEKEKLPPKPLSENDKIVQNVYGIRFDQEKERWKALRAQRKKRRAGHVNSLSQLSQKSGVSNSLSNYVESRNRELFYNEWQIIQVVPDPIPGSFTAWVYTDNKTLRPVKLEASRKLYINRRKKDELAGEYREHPVQRQLPRSRKSLNLTEVTLQEGDYTKNREVRKLLCDHNVEGVYEMNVPLLFRIIMSLGSVCKVKRTIRQNSVKNDRFKIDFLETCSSSRGLYLKNTESKTIFLYHSRQATHGIFGLFVQMGFATQLSFVVVRRAREKLDNVNIEKLARESFADKIDSEFQFDIKEKTSFDAGFAEVRKCLEAYKSGSHGATIVLAQVPMNLQELYRDLPNLRTDFPVVMLPDHNIDHEYPALQWNKFAIKRTLDRYTLVPEWWNRQLAYSRYARVPLGNMANDVPIYLADVAFSRALTDSSHVLWYSDSSRPDLGGLEEPENFFEDELSNPTIINPGCYRTVCIELEMSSLVISTVLESNRVDELGVGVDLSDVDVVTGNGGGNVNDSSGETSEFGVHGQSYNFDGASSSKAQFKILKNVLNNWLYDIHKASDETADTLLVNFYRWLRCTRSKLYDPALHRLVHDMMYKVLHFLVAQFKKLGAGVVYASFTKLIIDTGKTDVANAIAYCKYVKETIKTVDIFSWVDLEPVCIWESLLYYDNQNYGGIKMGGASVTDEDGDEEMDDDDVLTAPKEEIISHWNIADYLPKTAKQSFEIIISEFIQLTYQEIKRIRDAEKQTPASQIDPKEVRMSAFKDFVKNLVEIKFSRRLFKMIPDITHEERFENENGNLPDNPGRHLKVESMTVEFIKYICHILAVDPIIKDQVGVLRRNLFRMVDVRAFSTSAEFTNPCETYILPDVICEYCNACMDLDLCRDPDLLIKDHPWSCQHCKAMYDKSVIESSLVSVVQHRLLSYQVQDLMCTTCQSTKSHVLTQYCSCSGVYNCKTSPSDFLKSLDSFRRIATFHGFTWLQETVETIIEQV